MWKDRNGFFLFFYDFIYVFVRERVHKQGEWQAEGEAGSPLSREPDVGLNPRMPGSQPELKADAQLTELSRHPSFLFIQILVS